MHAFCTIVVTMFNGTIIALVNKVFVINRNYSGA